MSHEKRPFLRIRSQQAKRNVLAYCGLLGALGAAALPARAFAQAIPASPSPAALTQVQTPQRLSDWLNAQPAPTFASEPAVLHWRAKAEQSAQQDLRAALVSNLKGRLSALSGLLAMMPITGRVPLPSTDPRWMQANPTSDPVIQPGDALVWAPRAPFVTVLRASGYLCRVPHRPGAGIMAYVTACDGVRPPHAWVVQPDGAVFEHGVAFWNEEAQVEPAPGAWIWAPELSDGVQPWESAMLARFLATQDGAPPSYAWTQPRRLPAPIAQRAHLAERTRGLHVSSSDWGAVGLLQTPTARMEPVGSATLTFNRAVPYGSLKARLQPVEWLSVDFGYVSISDRLYGPAELSGDQAYKDKSADIKVRLLPESTWVPEIAVGARDLIGTGFFSSEYFVASKRWGDLDVSAGMAFGYMAGSQDFGNPFGLIAGRFKTRAAQGRSMGGTLNTSTLFRGRTALFGGLQYQLPSDKWLLKLEYEGNDYSREPSGRPIEQDSRFNLGVVYRYAPWLDVSVGFERGNRAVLTLSAHTQLDGLRTPKVLDPRRAPVQDTYPAAWAPLAQTAKDIHAQTDVKVSSIETDGPRMTLTLSDPAYGYQRPVINKMVAVAHRDAPKEIEQIDVKVVQRGVPVAQIEVDRKQWVRTQSEFLPPSERAVPPMSTVAVSQADGHPAQGKAGPSYRPEAADAFTYGLGLSYRQNLGGPDGFLLYQLATDLSAEWKLRQDTWVSGIARLRMLDNYDNFKYTAPSNLPRVRTYLREYLVTRRLTLPNLQLSHMGQAGAQGNHFYLAYGGLLESMYAGAGFEYLYRPVNSRLAIGVDVNRVRQRAFEQDFSMRDYQVNTGHVTAYWDTGFQDVVLKLSAGQYLAGDRGVTVDASRVFANGVSVGAYASKTNVSAEQFGEGSFDKGIYVNIPFDVMLPRSGAGRASIVYAPLLRDGGAKLSRRFNLYDITRARDPRALVTGDGSER